MNRRGEREFVYMAAWNDSGCLISVTSFWDCVPDADGSRVK